MKKIYSFFAATLVAFALLLTSANPTLAEGASYLNMEAYASGDIYFVGGTSFDNALCSKVDIWTTPGTEIGLTFGPRIGSALLGFGASAGNISGNQELTYANIDLTFNAPLPGSWNLSSYNLFQKGLHNFDDFILSRDWIMRDNSPWGLVGHNTKSGSSKWQLRWGPFYDFGPLTNFTTSNQLCAAIDLAHTSNAWVTWVVAF